ncbi:MAG: hypothetical protein ACHREM_10160 [Polyangiales bacterium]
MLLATASAGAVDLDTTKKAPTVAPASTDLTPTPPIAPTTLTPSPPIPTSSASAPDKARSATIPRSKSTTRSAAAPSTSASEVPEEPTPAATTEPPRAAPMGPLVTKSLSVGLGDLSIEIDVPDDWPVLPPRALPEPPTSDDPNAKDVKIIARKGLGVFTPDTTPPVVRETILVCATAPGELWADNIRDAAFTAMEVGVEKAIAGFTGGANVDVDAVTKNGERFEQLFHADAPFSRDGLVDVGSVHHGKSPRAPKVIVRGLSTIGFATEGSHRMIVACSIACAQLAIEGEKSVCEEIVASVRARGTWVAAPERSWLADKLFFLRNNPTIAWTGLIAFGVVLLASGLALVIVSRRRHASAREELDDEGDDDLDDERASAAPASTTPAIDDGTLEASAPPREGYFDPGTMRRR